MIIDLFVFFFIKRNRIFASLIRMNIILVLIYVN